MKLSTLAGSIGAALLLVLLAVEIFSFAGQQRQAKKEFQALQEKVNAAEHDNAMLKAQIQYLENPANLEKELRSKFNYRAQDEKMIILVPSPNHATSTTSTTSTP